MELKLLSCVQIQNLLIMIKNYILTISFLIVTTFSFSQNRESNLDQTKRKFNVHSNTFNKFKSAGIDTIFDHFIGVDTLVNYVTQNGFVAGHNEFFDKSKMQKFDSNYGVTGNGFITEILFQFSSKRGDTSGNLIATIWNDNNGKPGTIIGIKNFKIKDIDTLDFTSIVFQIPIPIPNDQIFYAGFEFDYTSTGKTGLYTSRDNNATDAPGVTGEFPDAITHTWEQASNNSYLSFGKQPGAWGLDVALGIFPVIRTTTGISNQPSELFTGVKNHPKPFSENTTLAYELKKSVENVVITISDVTGRVVSTYNQTNQTAGKQSVIIDGSELAAGLYNATINADGNSTSIRMIVK